MPRDGGAEMTAQAVRFATSGAARLGLFFVGERDRRLSCDERARRVERSRRSFSTRLVKPSGAGAGTRSASVALAGPHAPAQARDAAAVAAD